jgi:predicted transcriptional regulator YdeE
MVSDIHPTQDLIIAGLALRTNNTEAVQTLPQLWERFMGHDDGCRSFMAQVPGRLSDDIYAVYAEFDPNPPRIEDIMSLAYTCVIGVAVPSSEGLPAHLRSVTVPATRRRVFSVATGQPQQVGAKWQEIWSMMDLPRSFAADYERYKPNGEIDIFISVHG